MTCSYNFHFVKTNIFYCQQIQICDSVKYVQDFLEPRLANHKASVVKKEIPDFIDVCLKYNAREGKIINGRLI